jgi:hypothetical protein
MDDEPAFLDLWSCTLRWQLVTELLSGEVVEWLGCGKWEVVLGSSGRMARFFLGSDLAFDCSSIPPAAALAEQVSKAETEVLFHRGRPAPKTRGMPCHGSSGAGRGEEEGRRGWVVVAVRGRGLGGMSQGEAHHGSGMDSGRFIDAEGRSWRGGVHCR